METTPQFDRDLKRQEKERASGHGKTPCGDPGYCEHTSPCLEATEDHTLKGQWDGFRECHVGGEGDWLLVYIRSAGKLILFRTGKHDEIF